MKNIIIAIDIDDVIINLIDRWLYEYNQDFEDNLTRENITDWDLSKFVKPECGQKIYRYIEDRTMYDYCQPVKDSLEAVNLLRTMGRVVFVTASTIGSAGRKYIWLKENGYIDHLEDYIESKDKGLINFSFLIDDNYRNVCNQKNSFLFNQPWNAKYFYAQRIKNWREFIDARKNICS